MFDDASKRGTRRCLFAAAGVKGSVTNSCSRPDDLYVNCSLPKQCVMVKQNHAIVAAATKLRQVAVLHCSLWLADRTAKQLVLLVLCFWLIRSKIHRKEHRRKGHAIC